MPSVLERLIQRNSNVTWKDVSKFELCIHLMRIISFLGGAVIFYTPLDGHWFNQPVGGWDANRTIDSWGNFLWDWDWIDCVYFAMVTMTTVGYGDNPTLSQGLRIFTIFFACLGVVFVGGLIDVMFADWVSKQGQKRFIAQQRVVLEDSRRVAAMRKGKGKVIEGEGTRETPTEARQVLRRQYFSSIAIACDAASSWASLCFEPIFRRLPDMEILRRLQAPQLTFVFFGLCIILGEVENYQIEGCGGFGSGWSCGGYEGCDAWKLSHELGGYCWSCADEFYFGISTYLTIGYGDVHPHTKGGKLLAAFLVVFGVLSFATLLAEVNVMVRFGAHKTLRQRLMDLREVVEQDDNHVVTSGEFIFFNLKKMGKVDEDIINLLKEQFKALDMDSSGELDANDIAKLLASADQLSKQKQTTCRASGARHGARNVRLRGNINSTVPLAELASLELGTPPSLPTTTEWATPPSLPTTTEWAEAGEQDEGLAPPSPDFRARNASAEQQSMSKYELYFPMQNFMSGLGAQLSSYVAGHAEGGGSPTRFPPPAR